METLLHVVAILLLLLVVASNFMLCFKMDNFESRIKKIEDDEFSTFEDLLDNFDEIDQKLITISDDLNRFMQSLEKSSEDATPIKPNNWDSVREAFKGPVRIEINERN